MPRIPHQGRSKFRLLYGCMYTCLVRRISICTPNIAILMDSEVCTVTTVWELSIMELHMHNHPKEKTRWLTAFVPILLDVFCSCMYRRLPPSCLLDGRHQHATLKELKSNYGSQDLFSSWTESVWSNMSAFCPNNATSSICLYLLLHRMSSTGYIVNHNSEWLHWTTYNFYKKH